MADKNYYSVSDQNDLIIGNTTFPKGEVSPIEYSDIIKLSNATNITIKGCTVHGGKEDCIDMNRNCSNIVIEDTFLESNGNYCVTIKGGTKNVILKNITITNHGKEADIDLGNWSDQSEELTTDITLQNIVSEDGEPVKVRVLWADKPTVLGGNIKVVVIPRCLVRIYRFLRKRGLVP